MAICWSLTVAAAVDDGAGLAGTSPPYALTPEIAEFADLGCHLPRVLQFFPTDLDTAAWLSPAEGSRQALVHLGTSTLQVGEGSGQRWVEYLTIGPDVASAALRPLFDADWTALRARFGEPGAFTRSRYREAFDTAAEYRGSDASRLEAVRD